MESSEHNWANISEQERLFSASRRLGHCSFRIFWQISQFHKFNFYDVITLEHYNGAPRESVAPDSRKCGNLPIREILVITWPCARPSAPQVYQCKITQRTGMATQMQFEVILAGNRVATRVLWSRDNLRVNEDENGKRKLFLYPCCLKY